MARRPTALQLARRIVEAAVEITGDDANRAVAIEAALERIGLDRDEAVVGALFEAIQRGWLKVNDGPDKHTVKVGSPWRVESRSATKLQAGRKAAGGAGAPKRRKR